MRRKLFTLAAALVLFAASPGLAQIKIGVLSDLSGPTSDVGRPYADGVRHCVEYLNKQGGIAGQRIEMLQVDYAYNVQQAIAAYNRFKGQGIVALQGWGTADTEALVRFVARDEIPTYSASYSAHLADPQVAPFNFFIAADYSTQARAALQYFHDNWTEDRPIRLGLLYPNHPYGLAPIPAIKTFAQELGYELVAEDNVGLGDMDATSQLLRMQRQRPDYVWVGGTISSTAVILKDAQKVGMQAKFITNIWGSDEQLLQLAGSAVNGHYGLQTSVVFGTDVPGMEVIKEMTGGRPQMTHYIRGFASMYVMAESIRIAAEKGPLTGRAIRDASRALRDFDPMGLTPPISFFEDDHRPNMVVYIYQLFEDRMEMLAEQELERRPEWLGH
ncbi:ABC transporter substrate-binding protein [Desulfonatronum thioautotrophicum]|uniref:ABC transporter substrate-binding protein n=1 Tax=Desulfonatronum thioautotrophicum TaxID=617001 RepID=UPI0005EB3549|nr:ABC transporter substrate-binding protein [Desulfonatronum thioautotrophicum]